MPWRKGVHRCGHGGPHRHASCAMGQVAQEIYSVVRGRGRINYCLVRWLRQKYRRLRA